jgi:hypothetical protein
VVWSPRSVILPIRIREHGIVESTGLSCGVSVLDDLPSREVGIVEPTGWGCSECDRDPINREHRIVESTEDPHGMSSVHVGAVEQV